MPAKNLQRIDIEDLYLHIGNKGIDGKVIFKDEEDYQVFLNYLEEYLSAPKDSDSLKKTFQVNGRTFKGIPHLPKNYFQAVELLSYSLMPSHFHLLLHQVIKGSVENFLRSLCTRYSIYFNKKYSRTGSLFAGPYKSVEVNNKDLAPLTRFFHYGNEAVSTYPEYLGKRDTSWVKKDVVLAEFKQSKDSYKDFVQEYKQSLKPGGPVYKPEQGLERILLENESDHLERRDPASSQPPTSAASEALERRNPASSYDLPTDPDLQIHSRIPQFLVISTLVFVLLVTFSVWNINVSAAKSNPPLPPPAVLAETQEATSSATPEATSAAILEATASAEPEVKPEAKPKSTLTVKIDDGSSSVNIRQKPTTKSAKIGQAKDGNTFEFISYDADWFEVKLASGSAGFISAEYIGEEESVP